MSTVQNLDFLPGFALEGFPNRDSTMYKKLYDLPIASTILRGTLRFRGFSETIQGLQLLGVIDPNPHPILHPNGKITPLCCISPIKFICSLVLLNNFYSSYFLLNLNQFQINF